MKKNVKSPDNKKNYEYLPIKLRCQCHILSGSFPDPVNSSYLDISLIFLTEENIICKCV